MRGTRSPRAEAWARFRRNRPALVGLGLMAALAVFALVGPWVTRWDPNASDFTLRRTPLGAPPGPSAAHWLGVDHLFRDVFARLAEGARVSLAVGVAATGVATGIGAAAGVTAGMTEGTRLGALDTLTMRLVDVFLALPALLFITAVGVAVGRTDAGTVLLVLGAAGWMGTARLVRARTLQIRALDYVAAARALGAGPLRIVARHVLPSLGGMLVVVATTSVAQMILAEAVLGYLAVGIPPPRATWGRMLHEAEPFFGSRLALLAMPGFAILLSVLGFQRVGDGLRDALAGSGRDAKPVRPTGGRRLPLDVILAGIALRSRGAPPRRRLPGRHLRQRAHARPGPRLRRGCEPDPPPDLRAPRHVGHGGPHRA
jgi:ABC-type dipeptide/oligopeptide/nickel transport system permease subunit